MDINCYATISRCPKCIFYRIKSCKNVKPLQLFPVTAPLESISIYILGEFIKTKQGNIYFLVVIERFTKVVKTIRMKGVWAAEYSCYFVNQCVVNYGHTSGVLADNSSATTSKCFQEVWNFMNIQNGFPTPYYPQNNGQVEQYNDTNLATLRTIVADSLRDWDQYTDKLAYCYNRPSQTSTSIVQFKLVGSKLPGQLPLNPNLTDQEEPANSNMKWKFWLERTIIDTRRRL